MPLRAGWRGRHGGEKGGGDSWGRGRGAPAAVLLPGLESLVLGLDPVAAGAVAVRRRPLRGGGDPGRRCRLRPVGGRRGWVTHGRAMVGGDRSIASCVTLVLFAVQGGSDGGRGAALQGRGVAGFQATGVRQTGIGSDATLNETPYWSSSAAAAHSMRRQALLCAPSPALVPRHRTAPAAAAPAPRQTALPGPSSGRLALCHRCQSP